MVGVTFERIPTCSCKASWAVCVQMEKDLAKGGRGQRSEKAPGVSSERSRSCRSAGRPRGLTSRALICPHFLHPAPRCPLTVTSGPDSVLTQASDGSGCFQSPLPLTEAISAAADARNLQLRHLVDLLFSPNSFAATLLI